MGFFQKELLYVIIISLGTMEVGMSLAYYSPAYASVKAYFHLSVEECSLFNAITPICAIFGGLAIQFTVGKFSRKWLTFFSGLINGVGWILLIICNSKMKWLAFLARAIQGLGIGGTSTISPVYIAEISPTESRGSYGVMSQFFVSCGAAISYIMGVSLQWRAIAGVCIIPGCLMMIFILFIPNSPIDVKKILHESLVDEKENSAKDSLWKMKHMKFLLISSLLVVFQQFSGINALLSNLTPIFARSKVKLDPSISAFIVGAAQVITTGCSTPLVEKIGRKKTWIISSFGQVIFLFLSWSNEKWNYSNVLPLICLFFDVLVFGLGLGPLPWFVVPELFNDDVRSTAMSVVQALNWILCSTMMFAFESMVNAMTLAWVYFFYGFVMVLAFLYGLFLLPETQGKEMGLEK